MVGIDGVWALVEHQLLIAEAVQLLDDGRPQGDVRAQARRTSPLVPQGSLTLQIFPDKSRDGTVFRTELDRSFPTHEYAREGGCRHGRGRVRERLGASSRSDFGEVCPALSLSKYAPLNQAKLRAPGPRWPRHLTHPAATEHQGPWRLSRGVSLAQIASVPAPYSSDRPGRLSRVSRSACPVRHASIFAWSPDRSTSGTSYPRYSGGRVYDGAEIRRPS